MDELTVRDHLERLLPARGRGRQLLGWGLVAWSAIGAVILVGLGARALSRMAGIFPYLVVANGDLFHGWKSLPRGLAR